jgi:hypothetical protein
MHLYNLFTFLARHLTYLFSLYPAIFYKSQLIGVMPTTLPFDPSPLIYRIPPTL